MYRKLLKNAAFAALAIAAPVGAQTTAVSSSTTLQLPAVANADVDRYYQVTRNAPIWFRSGQAEAGPALINILKRAPIDGLARGPELAAEVEAALARAQTGDAAAVQAAERILSAGMAAGAGA